MDTATATIGSATLQSTNSSSTTPGTENSTQLTWIKLVCFAVIVAVGLTGNVIIIMATLKRRRMRPADHFVLNLAATDLATCLISIPFDFVEVQANNWPFGSFLCKIMYPLQTVFMAVSVYTLLVMSWERHRVVLRPSKPKIKQTRTLAIIAFIWMASFAVVGPYFAVPRLKVTAGRTKCDSESGWPSQDHAKAYTLAAFILLYLLPLMLITTNYIRISQKLWRDIQRLQRAVGGPSGNKKPLIKARAHRNMTIVKVFVLAVVAFATCMAPNHVMWMWNDFGSKTFDNFNSVLVFCHILVYANSAINPFVFMLLHRRHCKEFLMQWGFSICGDDDEKPMASDHNERRAKRVSERAQRNAHEMQNFLQEVVSTPTEEPYHYDLPEDPRENLDDGRRLNTRVNFKAERGVLVYQIS